MPNNVVKSLAKKSGKSVDDVEKLWDKAKKIAVDDGRSEDDEDFYPYVTGILKKMLKIKEDLDDETILGLISEMTGTGAVAMPQGPTGTVNGYPYFDADEDMFFNLHRKKRKSGQWFDKYYKFSEVAKFARNNRGKAFYLKYNDMYRKIKAN